MNPEVDINYMRSSPLHDAAWNGDSKMIQKLLINSSCFGGVNAADRVGNTSLHVAAHRGNAICALTLLKIGGANPIASNKDGWSPLHFASREGHNNVIRILIKFGGKVNQPDHRHFSPLSIASREGQTDTVKLLLRRGANIDPPSSSGVTPLLIACINNHRDTALLLAKTGGNIHKRSTNPYTPVEAALQHGWSKDLLEAAKMPSSPCKVQFLRSTTSRLYIQFKVPSHTTENTSIYYKNFLSNSSAIDKYEILVRESGTQKWISVENAFFQNPAKPGMYMKYIIRELKAGTEYRVKIRAHNILGWGPGSEPSESMKTKTSIPDTPSPPEILESNFSSITIEFEPPHNNGSKIDKYELSRKVASQWGHWGGNILIDSDKIHHTIENLETCANYRVRLRAHNIAGWSDWSIASEVMTTNGLDQLWYRARGEIHKLILHGHERMARDAFNTWIVEQHSRGWLMDVDRVTGMPCKPQLDHRILEVTQRVEGQGRRAIVSEWTIAQKKKRKDMGSILVNASKISAEIHDFKDDVNIGASMVLQHHTNMEKDEGEPSLIPLIYRSTPQIISIKNQNVKQMQLLGKQMVKKAYN